MGIMRARRTGVLCPSLRTRTPKTRHPIKKANTTKRRPGTRWRHTQVLDKRAKRRSQKLTLRTSQIATRTRPTIRGTKGSSKAPTTRQSATCTGPLGIQLASLTSLLGKSTRDSWHRGNRGLSSPHRFKATLLNSFTMGRTQCTQTYNLLKTRYWHPTWKCTKYTQMRLAHSPGSSQSLHRPWSAKPRKSKKCWTRLKR